MNTDRPSGAGQPGDGEVAIRPRLLTSREAAQMLRISERTLFSLSKRGELQTVRIGSRKLYDPLDIAKFIEASKGRSREDITGTRRSS